MQHQDWTPIIINQSIIKNQPKNIIKKEQNNKSSLPSGVKINENDEITSIKYVSKKISQQIINARCIKKMSRKDLAKNINVKEYIIADIENCKAIYNGNQIASIKKFLNIN